MAEDQIDLTNADEQIVAMNALLGKMYAQLVAPPGVEPAADDPTVFAWMTPSQPVPEDFFDYLEGFIPTGRDINVKEIAARVEEAGIPRDDPQFRVAMATAMQEERTAELNERWNHAFEVSTVCDQTPNLDIIFGENNDQTLMTLADNTGPMSVAYRQILDEIEIGQRPPDPEAKERLAEIEKLLFEPEADPPGAPAEGEDPDPFGSMLSGLLGDDSADVVTTSRDLPRPSKMVRVYDEMRAKYEASVAEYAEKVLESQTSAEAANHFNRFGAVHRRRVEDALRAWRSVGKKNEIEALQSMMSHLTRADMVAFVEGARIRYDVDDLSAQQGLAPFKYTGVVPGSIMALPWQTVTFDHSDIDRHMKHVKTSGGGRFGLNLGFWGVGGGGGASKETLDRTFDMTEIGISFEIAQVLLYRSWFTPSLFDSREWRLPGDQLLSDGAAIPSGRLRGYTDAMILVRDLSITHRDLHRYYEREKETLNARGGLRIGPFQLGGGGAKSSTTVNSGETETEGTLTMSGPAIAGFRCRRFRGQVPDPDPAITKWL
ncbi:MAG: hypothetical protein ACRBK7_23105 [Acidimicrobiales bacterium]